MSEQNRIRTMHHALQIFKGAAFAAFTGWAASAAATAQVVEITSINTVRISGTLTNETVSDFRRLIAEMSVETVELDSPGGSVHAALRIADLIHARRLSTHIGSEAECYSACAYIFLAGYARMVQGRLGVHQISSDLQDNTLTQAVVSEIYASLSDYGTPEEVIEIMLRTPPAEMHVFSSEEISYFSIERRQPNVELPHLQVVSSSMSGDWLVGRFLNTHTGQPFFALESRLQDPVLRIVHYPGRNQSFGELIWRNGTFRPDVVYLRFLFERDANDRGPGGVQEVVLRADLDSHGYSWDFQNDQSSVAFMNRFIYGHRLRVEDISGSTIASFSLEGSFRATTDFLKLFENP